jgi:hypothetical protein
LVNYRRILLSSNPASAGSDKTIDTLVEDIYELFDKEVTVPEKASKAFSEDLTRVVVDVFRKRPRYLRLSNLSSPCRRKLWYSINTPELAEKLPGYAHIKFLIGHVTEAVILFLARLAGHSVTDEQREVNVHGVSGHIDGMVDGDLVDVKSASPYSFKKFEGGLRPESDSFGYLGQLGSYGNVLGTRRGHFLAVDKVLGKLHLDTHELPEKDLKQEVEDVRAILADNEPPPRGFEDEADGASGNRKLGTICSYCDFKDTCWPGLQVYKYARGPIFLTKVVRPPKVDRVES